MMMKFGFIIAALMLAANAIADNSTAFSNITISAAETGSTVSWTVDKSESKKTEKDQIRLLAKTADALNEELNAKLEKNLEDKFNNQLND